MRKLLFAAAAVAALASASATAQNATPDNPAKGTAGTSDKMNSSAAQGGVVGPNSAPDTPANPRVTLAAPTEGPSFVQVKNSDMLSSNVVGLDIYNGQKDKVGKIQDVALTRQSR
jgi:hypothetical protein